MSTQHTPGPWELRRSVREYWFIDHEQGGEGYTLTKLDCNEADAHLIAAAPELLAALQRALDAIEYYHAREGSPDTLADARAAIAKAQGGAA